MSDTIPNMPSLPKPHMEVASILWRKADEGYIHNTSGASELKPGKTTLCRNLLPI